MKTIRRLACLAVMALAAAASSFAIAQSAPVDHQVVATSHAGVAAVDVGIPSAVDHKESMSYSFSVSAASKVAALAAAAARFDAEVVAQQPVHKVDREAALKNAEAHLGLIRDPGAGEQVILAMHGSVGGEIDWTKGEATSLSSAGSGCTAWLGKVDATA